MFGLLEIGMQLIRLVLPVIITAGVVGNSLNIAVLTRPTLYHHPCSRYFLALASKNLFYSSILFINRLLSGGYQINLSNHSIVLCKIITYIGTLSSFLAPYFIVCASIHRYCTTSTNALLRRFSNVRIAKWMVFTIVAVFSLFFIHILVFTVITQDRGFNCAVQANTIYSQVYIITQVFLFAVIPPSLMMLFGFMTIQNPQRTNVVPVVASRYNRTEQQLARMLFVQVVVQIVLTLPVSVTYLISVIPNTIRTTSIFSFTSTICTVFFYCSYITSFFLYLLSGRMYRKELIRLVYTLFKIGRGNHVAPAENQTIDLGVTTLVIGNRRA
jgi:hypothetical protein